MLFTRCFPQFSPIFLVTDKPGTNDLNGRRPRAWMLWLPLAEGAGWGWLMSHNDTFGQWLT